MNSKNSEALVLEIFKQDKTLSMSIFEQKEIASTLRHYSQAPFSYPEISKLCLEITAILNRADKNGILDEGLVNNLKKTGQLLWDHLFTKAVKDKLKSTHLSDLILSLDEELILIPWELLYTGSDFFCLKFNLGRVVRTKEQPSIPQYRSSSGSPKMLILANPTNDLKSAYLEGAFIKNQFDKKRKEIGIDFKSSSIDTLYVKKNLRDYDIVHFAGHCEYDLDDPKHSGWVLSDARFTTQDIYALGETLALPSLVFSNACQSAQVSPDYLDTDYQEKTYSLAAAFLFSGVRHYIGTIRKVEDKMGLNFAKEFYTHLISGRSVGESLRLSRLALIREYGIAAVGWMSYLVYGDPNFILFRQKAKAPALKLKNKFLLSKKLLLRLSLMFSIIIISLYLYIWLPTLNPNTYIMFSQARSLFLKGRNEEVISVLDKLIKKEPLFLSAYPLAADTYQRIGDKENALKSYFAYALYSEKRNDRKNLTSAYIGIGWVYHLQGNYQKAFDFYNQALVLTSENKDKLNEADVLGKIAIWHMDKGDNDKALELLTKSAEINRPRQNIYKHRYNLACDYFNLGLVFTNKDDFTAAREFYDKSFKLFQQLKLTHELSDYYFNVGEIYVFKKEYQKALDNYHKGLKIDLTLGNKFNLASDYNMLGELYVQMDNFKEAEECFHQAVLLSKEIDALPELAATYYNFGQLYKKRGMKNKVKEYLREAQQTYRKIDSPLYQKIKEEFLNLDNP